MTIAEFGVLDITASLFTADFHFNPHEVLKFALDNWVNRLNGASNVLNLPPNAPQEIPRVTLEGNNNGYKLTAAPVRVDVHWTALNQQTQTDLNAFFGWANEVFGKYKQMMNCRAVRLAGVVHRFRAFPTSEEAAQQLARNFARSAGRAACWNAQKNSKCMR